MTLPIGYFAGNLDPVFPEHQNHIPKIEWDGNTLEFGMPLLEVQRYSEGDSENEGADVQEGFKDGWKVGFNQYLSAIVPYVPRLDEISSYNVPVTGWEGATGWRAFLLWAFPQRIFSFFPNRLDLGTIYTCYLIEPYGTKADFTTFFARRPRLVLATSDQQQFRGY